MKDSLVEWFKESVIEDNLYRNNLAIQLHREQVMAGIILSTLFPDVAFLEDLLLGMKQQHDERIRIWLEEVKRVNKPFNPLSYNYWTHIDLDDSDLEASSASRSDSNKEETDNESGSDNSNFMDNVNVDGGDKNSMSNNPRKLFEKYPKKATIQILRKLQVWKAQKLMAMHLQKKMKTPI